MVAGPQQLPRWKLYDFSMGMGSCYNRHDLLSPSYLQLAQGEIGLLEYRPKHVCSLTLVMILPFSAISILPIMEAVSVVTNVKEQTTYFDRYSRRPTLRGLLM